MSLPTRIKMNIRDLWDSPESDVQKAFGELKKLIGYEVSANPEWALLWTEMKSKFPDNAGFVPAIASSVVGWCKALQDIAEEDKNEEWTEELLEKSGKANSVRIMLEAGNGRPTTRWLDRANAFEICFTKSADSPHAITSIMIAGFHSDLLRAFKPMDEVVPFAARSTATATQPDETWADVNASELDSASVFTPSTDRVMASRPAPLDMMPNINTIDRPEELTKRPPYHLILRTGSDHRHMVIQGSHQASLELLAEYLTRWSKRNHNFTNKPAAAEVTLRGSSFGLATLYDRIEIEPQHNDNWTKMTPTLILCFIESVLGYRLTYQEAYGWHFRRDTGFR